MSHTIIESADSAEREEQEFMESVDLTDTKESVLDRVTASDKWDDEDLIHGQPVIIAVRWIMIVTALILAVWNVESMQDLRLQIIAILLLAITNFYLQAQLLMKKPLNRMVVYGASAVDLIMITLLVMFQGGYHSSIYVFYLPAMAAFAVAFPRGLTAAYTGGTVLMYGLICLITAGAQADVIVARLIMLVAVAFCGALYLGLEHQRRNESREQEASFLQDIAAARPKPA